MIDGKLAGRGAKPITTLTFRRALNLTYFMVMENMSAEERDDFESKLYWSMLDLKQQAAEEKRRNLESRKRLAIEFGEVG